jgi:polysaccharide export outer membrane protein
MPTQPVKVFQGSAAGRAAVLLGAWLVLAANGCAYRCYDATSLPTEFVAQPTEKVDTSLVARLADNAVSADCIGPGDLLDVTIDQGYGEEPVRTSPVWVEEDGTARIPTIGAVRLAGLTLRDAGQMIAAAGVERGSYVDPYPYVTVEMKRQRTNRVTVIGAVASPGVKQLPRSASYLLAALVSAGNLTDDASPKIDIIQFHGGSNPLSPESSRVAGGPQVSLTSSGEAGSQGPRTVRVDLVSTTEPAPENPYLDDGDVVVVRQRDPRSIHVIGLIDQPGQYKLPPNEDLDVLSALALAGGRKSQLADKVWILRQVPGQEEPVRIQVSVREAKRNPAANARLAPGDLVSVEETPATFVFSLMQNFFRFGLSGSVPLF